ARSCPKHGAGRKRRFDEETPGHYWACPPVLPRAWTRVDKPNSVRDLALARPPWDVITRIDAMDGNRFKLDRGHYAIRAHAAARPRPRRGDWPVSLTLVFPHASARLDRAAVCSVVPAPAGSAESRPELPNRWPPAP